MIRPKSAQSANNAAVVIIIIAVMIILYILFLPPEERAALLGEDGPGGPGGPGGSGGTGVLVSKTPGRLYPAGANMVEHPIPSFIVFTVTNANELRRVESLYVKNSAFSDQMGEVIFYYDPATTEDVKLSYSVGDHSGRLRIILNGNPLFEGEVSGSPAPLALPKEYLRTRNQLLFDVSEPGVAFWRVNDYDLQSVLISGRVTDYSGSRAEQHFTISDQEFEQIDKATLQFLPDCPPGEAGQLQLLLNSRPVYTSFPDCGVRTTIEVSKDFLKPQDNVLVGSTSAGSFLVDQPKITTSLKASAEPVFYFNVPPTLLDAMYSGHRGLALTLRFPDSDKIKRGTIEVNGFKMFFETQDFIYQTYLDIESILEGPNSIKVTPQSEPMDVVELRVDVVA